MKAIVKTKREPGIEVLDWDVPALGETDVLVKVMAGSLCGSDVHMYEWTPSYHFVPVPIIMGHEFSGEVADVGPKVDKVKVGDRITSKPSMPCSDCSDCLVGRGDLCTNRLTSGLRSNGFFAEYASITSGADIFKLPENISFEAASLLEPLVVSLNAVDISHLQLGNTAAILGPGPIGLLTLQLLKAGGASLVIMAGTGSDRKRLELAKKLGADIVVDVEKEDLVKTAMELTGNSPSSGLDIVYEATGNPKSVSQGLNMIKEGGKLVLIGIHSGPAEFDPTLFVRGGKTILGAYGSTSQTWQRALTLMSTGKVDVETLITHRMPLSRAEEGFALAIKKEAVKIIFTP